ncbi:MAG: hypothetical protein U0105_12445 [Candidatus Obscuribacterales bacterium]
MTFERFRHNDQSHEGTSLGGQQAESPFAEAIFETWGKRRMPAATSGSPEAGMVARNDNSRALPARDIAARNDLARAEASQPIPTAVLASALLPVEAVVFAEAAADPQLNSRSAPDRPQWQPGGIFS